MIVSSGADAAVETQSGTRRDAAARRPDPEYDAPCSCAPRTPQRVHAHRLDGAQERREARVLQGAEVPVVSDLQREPELGAGAINYPKSIPIDSNEVKGAKASFYHTSIDLLSPC